LRGASSFCARKSSQTQLSLIEGDLISCLGETLQLRRLVAFATESLHLSMRDLAEAFYFSSVLSCLDQMAQSKPRSRHRWSCRALRTEPRRPPNARLIKAIGSDVRFRIERVLFIASWLK